MVFRLAALAVLAAAVVIAAQFRLYLTDGTYHIVREYERKEDRVRFYSVERSQWEEIPLDLADLERTERERLRRAEARQEELEFWQREEAAERARQREIARVPRDPGVYLVMGEEIRPLSQAELDVLTDKKKEFLKIITPIPIISGKRTVVIKGPRSEWLLPDGSPRFYIRLHREERFAIIRLTTKDDFRIVEKWDVMPVTDQVYEQHEDIEVFRREVGDNLYMIWPKQPLEPGEYAVVEFSQGEANIQAWDFAYWPEEAQKPE